MSTLAKTVGRAVRSALLTLLVVAVASPSIAQHTGGSSARGGMGVVQTRTLPAIAASSAAVDLTSHDMRTLDRRGWKLLTAQVLRDLKSESSGVRLGAVGLIVIATQQYPGRANFRGGTNALLRMFSDGSEGERLGAVAALHAVDDRSSMDTLMRLTQFEKSPNVRRVAEYAVADHYGLVGSN